MLPSPFPSMKSALHVDLLVYFRHRLWRWSRVFGRMTSVSIKFVLNGGGHVKPSTWSFSVKAVSTSATKVIVWRHTPTSRFQNVCIQSVVAEKPLVLCQCVFLQRVDFRVASKLYPSL